MIGVLRFLPQFVISAVVSYFIFNSIKEMKKPFSLNFSIRPKDKQYGKKSVSNVADQNGIDQLKSKLTHYSSPFTPVAVDSDLRVVNAILVSIISWILLTAALSGLKSASLFLPRFPNASNQVIYLTLAGGFSISLISAMALNLANKKIIKVISMFFVVIITVLASLSAIRITTYRYIDADRNKDTRNADLGLSTHQKI